MALWDVKLRAGNTKFYFKDNLFKPLFQSGWIAEAVIVILCVFV